MDGIVDDLAALIGRTPLVRLNRMTRTEAPEPPMAEVCVKLETHNPGGSVKDRPAKHMLDEAEASGRLSPGATIVEATSGNTGISLAMIAAARGYRCVLIMPEDMSIARRQLLKALGAELILTPAENGMRAAVERAQALLDSTPGAFMPRQFQNAANPNAHAQSTGPEIWHATQGKLDAFVAGVGTGGTLTGTGRYLRSHAPQVELIAVEPKGSPVLSGGAPGLHGIQGLGAGFVPDILDQSLISEVMTVSDPQAQRCADRLAAEEGILAGPSAGANVYAALQVAKRLGPGKRVVTLICDGLERYLC